MIILGTFGLSMGDMYEGIMKGRGGSFLSPAGKSSLGRFPNPSKWTKG